MKQEVIDKLYQLSRKTGKPVQVITGGGAGKGNRAGWTAHEHGLAADVYIEGYNSKEIADKLAEVGFTGIGVYYNKDWTPTSTAHGDIRGSEAAKGTVYYNQVTIPSTWNGHDISDNPKVRVWEGTKEGQPWRWGPVSTPGQASLKSKKTGAPKAGAPMGKKLISILALFLMMLLIFWLIGTYVFPEGGGGGGGGGGEWQIYTDTGQQYATLYVNSDGTFTGDGWTGYAPGIGTYDIYITNGLMSGTSITFETYASYGSGSIEGSYWGELDAPFPAATYATWQGSGWIMDPLGDREFVDSGTATRS